MIKDRDKEEKLFTKRLGEPVDGDQVSLTDADGKGSSTPKVGVRTANLC